MPYNFALIVFTQSNFAADVLGEKYTFRGKNGQFAFLSSLWGLGATYAVHLRLIGELVVDFLLVIIELFSLAVTDEVLYERISIGNRRFRSGGRFGPKFQVEGDVPHQPFFMS